MVRVVRGAASTGRVAGEEAPRSSGAGGTGGFGEADAHLVPLGQEPHRVGGPGRKSAGAARQPARASRPP
ncbi:hypothetical protein DEF23_16070 [Marinitenerispora sediminis]|uniref:Uncharacterized protein n=1 Tax=Marinitenerispora sediminis TaxID=1931232 RepID=A0A368T009_9ACTN|nr:hypothetical protein DEF24_22730 [Marinitenerispora sediminis]RCV54280.1 hypothetical protein DEF23_16070 [Marinitenerispora sediminis]RCV56432.1 hypothetical protein DEF28_03805 [Marinitenerispora sediminis]